MKIFSNKKIDISKFFKVIGKNSNNFKKKFNFFKKKKSISFILKSKFTNYFFNIIKLIFAIIFTPLFLVFSLFEIKLFLKIFRQIVAIIYFLVFLIFIYTLFNQNKTIGTNEIIMVNIDFKDKIKNF